MQRSHSHKTSVDTHKPSCDQDGKMTMKAEDIAHVLRDGIALLPGGRCRAGQAIIVCPSREQPVNQDHLRNVFLYLFEVTAKVAREKGFSVVIDMRGKQTWTNVRQILKALSSIESTSTIQVFIIKPDKFWEKQKAQLSLGTWDFEVEMYSFESLVKFIDSSMLPKCVGGTYPYDNDEWLEMRLELEAWIWKMTDLMEKLESVRRDICEGEQPVDVRTADAALKKSHVAKKNIFTIPVEELGNEADRIITRISAAKVINPDLQATIPYVSNLIDSLRLLKGDVYTLWGSRQAELELVYKQKLFVHDAEKMIENLRSYKNTAERSMGNVGNVEEDVHRLTAEFEQFQLALQNMEVSVQQVFQQLQHLSSINGRNPSIDQMAKRLDEEWRVVNEQKERRRIILLNARNFFVSAQRYFAEVPEWMKNPGVNPSDVMLNQNELETAITLHDAFRTQVEDVYAQAYDDSTKVSRALKDAHVEDNVSREHASRLQKTHKQLLEKWKERQTLLHHMLAMIAFEKDVQLVVDWLEQHGETYLRRNNQIGKDLPEARRAQHNHNKFRDVASNTYDSVKKLGKVVEDVTSQGSKLCDIRKMQSLMAELRKKIEKFTAMEQSRDKLLRYSTLFHTHYKELTDWYARMKEKYEDRTVDLGVQECDANKELFVVEMDETAQAYAMTFEEGNTLLHEMKTAITSFGVDYTESVKHIQTLMADIEEKNAAVVAQYSSRRTLLFFASKFAMFEQNKNDVIEQIKSWEDDMREVIGSEAFYENASTVMKFHADNQKQVRNAIDDIQKTAKELLQILGDQVLKDRAGRNVRDVITEHRRELQRAESEVMEYADDISMRIHAACEVAELRKCSNKVCRIIENQIIALQNLLIIPVDYNDAMKKQEDLKNFRDNVQSLLKEPYDYFVIRFRQLCENGLVDREEVVIHNERIVNVHRRLMAHCEEKNKLLKSAHGFYKTYETILPLLEYLENDYHTDKIKDWCDSCPSPVHADRAAFVADLLSKHMNYKERFGKGCLYAQRHAEFLLRYIRRTQVNESEQRRHEAKIAHLKTTIRERQSNILGLWTHKKELLDGCQAFIFIDASAKELLDWMSGEGEQELKKFEKKGRGSSSNVDDDEFAAFKLEVKQKKLNIQSFLHVTTTNEQLKRGVHDIDIENCIRQVKDSFDRFSRRVRDCEVVIRGENGGTQPPKDEFSLDRHSDPTIFAEGNIYERREENRKMLEPMRELIQSERDYIKDIERCVSIYVNEFDTAVNNGTIPTSLSSKKTEIFGNIDKIYWFHNNKLIDELVKYEHQPETVGTAFTVWIDLLKELYTEYCVNKEQNNNVIATPDAIAFFNSIREKHSLEINNEIASLLIKPVQRITRYQLLLNQLLKLCPSDKSEDLKEAHNVVCSVPRKVNDLIHFHCLDLKDNNVDELGPFVFQDTLTVWEPRAYFKGRGKERQVFLFDLSIVFAKKLEISQKNVKYVIKGKPLPLSEVSIVEHVEGDPCRFGLRLGSVASNENRTDLKAASGSTKIKWVQKIRELNSGLLPMGLSVSPAFSATTLTSARTVSIRSGASTSSGGDNRQSQDVESLFHHRTSKMLGYSKSWRSLRSRTGSLYTRARNRLTSSFRGGTKPENLAVAEFDDSTQSSEVWIVTEDFDGQDEGHLKVQKGDRVEILEEQATDAADFLQVVLCEQPTKHGLVPRAILVSQSKE
ncbi:unnamed protein product [Caenorhabditis sp. 36 PRJEB53466]|nr:unnamed protein product [Caenorhabditis sp. 36 PRJEB53466]